MGKVKCELYNDSMQNWKKYPIKKAQQENPHLKATAEVQGFRYDKETEFMKFAVKG